MKKEPENMIKGAIGEIIAEEIFKELGFFVMKLGKEHTVNPLTQLQNFIKSCKGQFSLEKLGDEIKEITSVNVLPDFVVVHPNGKVALLEVKFRWNGILYPHDELLFNTYPEAHMLVINLETNDKIVQEMDEKGLEKLKESRFHVWFSSDCVNIDTLEVLILEEWLKEEFAIENNEVIKKYGDLVKKWLGNEEVFKKIVH